MTQILCTGFLKIIYFLANINMVRLKYLWDNDVTNGIFYKILQSTSGGGEGGE